MSERSSYVPPCISGAAKALCLDIIAIGKTCRQSSEQDIDADCQHCGGGGHEVSNTGAQLAAPVPLTRTVAGSRYPNSVPRRCKRATMRQSWTPQFSAVFVLSHTGHSLRPSNSSSSVRAPVYRSFFWSDKDRKSTRLNSS